MVTKISKKVNTAPTKGKAKPISKARDNKDMKKYQDKQKRRQERKDKAKKAQKQVSRRDTQEGSDEDNFDDIDGSDYDDEMAQVQEDLDADKNLDETIFDQFQSGELDLPSEGEDLSDDDDVEMSDGEDADDLDDYYRELGIDPDEMKPQVQ